MTNRPFLSNCVTLLFLMGIVATFSFTLLPATPARSEAVDTDAHGDDDGHTNEPQGHDGPVILDAHDIERMGIVVAPAGPGTIRKILRLPGEIKMNEDRVAHIVPRFDGIVREVRKHLGDKVRAGEVMAVIESNTSLQVYEIKSLTSGTVVQKHVTLGEFVSTNADVYVVADLSDVWAIISVYARDQGSVATGQFATIISNDMGFRDSATITYVSPIVDEHTRTTPARVVLSNAHGRWRPGSFITTELLLEETTVPVAVPSRAVESLEGHEVVFVQENGGFAPREVRTGLINGTTTEIVSGLGAGELIVVEGSFTLKAELMKSSFGEGHGH